jgi:hypothetical protein
MRPNDKLVVPAAAAAGINTLPPGLSGARWWVERLQAIGEVTPRILDQTIFSLVRKLEQKGPRTL